MSRSPCDMCGTQRCPGGESDPCKEYLDWKEKKGKYAEPKKVRIADLGLPRVKVSPLMPPVKALKGQGSTHPLIGKKIRCVMWVSGAAWHNFPAHDMPTIVGVCEKFFEVKFNSGTEWINQDEFSRFRLE